MLTEPTFQKLRALHLPAFAKAWAEQQQDPQSRNLSFDERLALLADAEILSRENKRLQQNLKDAKLKIAQACIEDFDPAPGRGLDRAFLRELATCRYIDDHQNVVITGPTGVGKTYLACALAQKLCRRGGRVPPPAAALRGAHTGSRRRLLLPAPCQIRQDRPPRHR
jgi:DNA replication protein DnaC